MDLNSISVGFENSQMMFLVENMFWEKWEAHDFLDRNHLNGDGRQKNVRNIGPDDRFNMDR